MCVFFFQKTPFCCRTVLHLHKNSEDNKVPTYPMPNCSCCINMVCLSQFLNQYGQIIINKIHTFLDFLSFYLTSFFCFRFLFTPHVSLVAAWLPLFLMTLTIFSSTGDMFWEFLPNGICLIFFLWLNRGFIFL